MSQLTRASDSTTIRIDSSLFSVGFVVGLILGKIILRNTLLAVAFGTGLGLAVGSSSDQAAH